MSTLTALVMTPAMTLMEFDPSGQNEIYLVRLIYQVDPLVKQSDPVKDDHFFCPCICNIVFKVRQGSSKCVKPTACVISLLLTLQPLVLFKECAFTLLEDP